MVLKWNSRLPCSQSCRLAQPTGLVSTPRCCHILARANKHRERQITAGTHHQKDPRASIYHKPPAPNAAAPHNPPRAHSPAPRSSKRSSKRSSSYRRVPGRSPPPPPPSSTHYYEGVAYVTEHLLVHEMPDCNILLLPPALVAPGPGATQYIKVAKRARTEFFEWGLTQRDLGQVLDSCAAVEAAQDKATLQDFLVAVNKGHIKDINVLPSPIQQPLPASSAAPEHPLYLQNFTSRAARTSSSSSSKNSSSRSSAGRRINSSSSTGRVYQELPAVLVAHSAPGAPSSCSPANTHALAAVVAAVAASPADPLIGSSGPAWVADGTAPTAGAAAFRQQQQQCNINSTSRPTLGGAPAPTLTVNAAAASAALSQGPSVTAGGAAFLRDASDLSKFNMQASHGPAAIPDGGVACTAGAAAFLKAVSVSKGMSAGPAPTHVAPRSTAGAPTVVRAMQIGVASKPSAASAATSAQPATTTETLSPAAGSSDNNSSSSSENYSSGPAFVSQAGLALTAGATAFLQSKAPGRAAGPASLIPTAASAAGPAVVDSHGSAKTAGAAAFLAARLLGAGAVTASSSGACSRLGAWVAA